MPLHKQDPEQRPQRIARVEQALADLERAIAALDVRDYSITTLGALSADVERMQRLVSPEPEQLIGQLIEHHLNVIRELSRELKQGN